jgi:hypothetical protein
MTPEQVATGQLITRKWQEKITGQALEPPLRLVVGE